MNNKFVLKLKKIYWRIRDKYKSDRYSWIKINRISEKIAFFIFPKHFFFRLKRIGLEDYCALKQSKIIKVFDSDDVYGPLPCQNIDEFENYNPEHKYYKTFMNKIYELNNVYIAGDADMCFDDEFCVDERWIYYKNEVLERRYHYIEVSSDERNVILRRGLKVREVDAAISLIKEWSSNYFHFTLEAITRLQYVDNIDEYKDFPILINAEVLYDSRNIELIQAINVKNRKVIAVKQGEIIRVKRLVIPPIHLWKYRDDNGLRTTVVNPGLGRYATNIAKKVAKKEGYPKKVYITRGNNNRLLNESEVCKIFAEYGFEIINPEKMSWKEEVSYFYNADYIAGVIGAAFTNLLYCRKNTVFIQICPFKFQLVGYGFLAEICGMKTININPKIEKDSNVVNGATFKVDLKYVKSIINNI